MGYELKKLMNMYGVSTPTMAAAPQMPGAAPTAVAELVKPELRAQPAQPVKPTKPRNNAPAAEQEAYQAALTAYNAQKNAYNTDIKAWKEEKKTYDTALKDYNTALPKYQEDLAKYEKDKAAFDETARKYGLDKAQYDQYAQEYQNRLANTNMYNQAQFSTTGANVPPITTFSDAQKAALGYGPAVTPTVGAPTAGGGGATAPVMPQPGPQDFTGIGQGGLNQQVQQYMGTNPSMPDLNAYMTRYGLTDYDIRNAMGTGTTYGTPQWTDMLASPVYGANYSTGTTGTRGGYIQNYAQGGRIKNYAPGGLENRGAEGFESRMGSPRAPAPAPVDPSAALEAMLNRYAPQTVTSEQIAAASERRLAEQKAFEDILRSQLQSTDSNPMSKAEKYFRLAAAFGAPTKTGHFSENLALVGETLAEDLAAKAQREREARERGLGVELEIQKMRMGTAGEEYDALRGIQSEEAKYRRDVANELLKEQIASGKAGYTQVTGAELGLTGDDAGKMFNVSPEGQVTAIGGAGTTVNVGGEGATDAMNKKLAEAEGALLATYLQQGPIASGALQDLSLLQEILPMAPQNPLTGRVAEMFPGVSSAGAAASSVIKRVAPTLRVEGSGSSSDIEYNGMLQSLPALQNYPEANAAIVAMMQAKAAINLERSELVRAYSNSKKTDEDAATLRAKLSELDKRSIMTPELRNTIAMLSGVGGGGVGGPVTIEGTTIERLP